MNFVARHPVWVFYGAVFTVLFLIAYPIATLVVIAAGLLAFGSAFGLVELITTIDHQHKVRRAERRRLEMDADYQHWLIMQHHPAGFFGRFPPRI